MCIYVCVYECAFVLNEIEDMAHPAMSEKRLQRESFIIKCTVICECVRIVQALKLNKSFVDTFVPSPNQTKPNQTVLNSIRFIVRDVHG